MATLPNLGGRSTARPSRGIASFDPGREGIALQNLGGTMGQAADEMHRRQEQEADAQAVFAARRQIDDWERATLYDSQNGVVAKYGQDAFDLPEKIPQAFDTFASKVLEASTAAPLSARARQSIQELVISRRDQALNFVNRHALQQRQVFEEGQVNADVDSTLNRAAAMVDAGDLGRARAEVATAETRVVGFMRARGKSEEEIAQRVREVTSRAAISAVNLLLERDKPAQAEEYLKANGSSMRLEDLVRAQAAVGKAMDSVRSEQVADEIFRTKVQPAVQPTDVGRLENLVMLAESAGRRFGPDGKLLTSPKGAQGEMQVMPATAKDPGYGIKPAKDDSPDELARVGSEYLGAMLREFGGDVQKALAAYNAGPARVKQALEESARGRSGSVDWLSYLPQETQAYVTKISTAYAKGGGAAPMPTLADLQDQVRTMIPAERPEMRKQAIAALTTRYRAQQEELKQLEDENTARAYQWLAGNGGRFTQMPAALRARVPAKELDNLLNYGERIARGEDITDPVIFQKMATDDAWLRRLTDAQFYLYSRKLSQADAQQMALRRGKLLSGSEGQSGPGSLDTAGVNSILNNRLQQIGTDPTPKDDTKEARRVGAIRKFVWDRVLQAQQAAGKRLNDAEAAAVIDKLFAQNVKFQTTFLGIRTGTESQRLLSMSADDIPNSVKVRLREDFKREGISDPTDADFLGAYFELKFAQRPAR